MLLLFTRAQNILIKQQTYLTGAGNQHLCDLIPRVEYVINIKVSIHTAGLCTKNRYINICIYVDSLRLFAASSPTGVVAQLVARWIALLRFLGSNPDG